MTSFFTTFLFSCLLVSPVYSDSYFTIDLQADADQRYIVRAQMATGDAAQNFGFALAMGTPFTSVAGTSCNSCNSAPSFNESVSTTAQVLSGSGSISLIGGASTSGGLIKENCFLAASNGSAWAYPNQTIVMSDQSSDVYNGQVSGIFGLASGYTNGSQNLLNSSVIGGVFGRNPQRASFSYGMALSPPSSSAGASVGVLHWLAPDQNSYTGTVAYVNTTISSSTVIGSAAEMSFDLDGWSVNVGGNTVSNSNQDLNAALDPYYPNIFFPSSQAQLIHAAISGASPQSGDNGQSTVWSIPCSTDFTLTVHIASQTFTLDQSSLIQTSSNGTCYSYIRGWTDATIDQYLFGANFISSLYVIVQVGNPSTGQASSYGFAQRSTSSSSSIVGPVVGGVVGGVAGIAIIALGIFFFVRRRDQRKLRDMLDAEDVHGRVGAFVGPKPVEPFMYTVPPSATTPGSPGVADPLLPPSYEQSNSPQQQQHGISFNPADAPSSSSARDSMYTSSPGFIPPTKS